jgi:hypothetical protein
LKGPGDTRYLDTLYLSPMAGSRVGYGVGSGVVSGFGSGVGSKVFIQLNRVRVFIRPGGQSRVFGPGFLCDDVEV